MQGFRPVSTPQGIQFQSPDNHSQYQYRGNPAYVQGFERGNYHQHGLGRSPSYHSLNPSRSYHNLPPSRQQGSTCIADPFMDRPHFLRPSTAPVLSSPSSTIFFDEQRNPDLKMRTLAWRKGYGGYPYGGMSREAELIGRNYEAIVNNEMFGKRTNDKIYPTIKTWRDWKWKQLDEDTLKRCHRHDIQPDLRMDDMSFKPRYTRGVSFFDPDTDFYLASQRRTGPPKTSHLQDHDRRFHSALYDSCNLRTPTIVGNLPGRYANTNNYPVKGILKNGCGKHNEKTSPVFHAYHYIDESRRGKLSTSTQTSKSPHPHPWFSPAHGTVSAEVIEVYRSPNIYTSRGAEKLRKILNPTA